MQKIIITHLRVHLIIFAALFFTSYGLPTRHSIDYYHSGEASYAVEIDIPYLEEAESHAAVFNNTIKEIIDKEVSFFKKEYPRTKKKPARADNECSITHSIDVENTLYISLHLILYSYYQGTAHGYYVLQTINFDRKKGTMLTLVDLFKPTTPYLNVIADYCLNYFMQSLSTDEDSDMIKKRTQWIAQGTAPKAENYTNWHVTPQGLHISFDCYQVGTYCDGMQSVTIPHAVLKKIYRHRLLEELGF